MHVGENGSFHLPIISSFGETNNSDFDIKSHGSEDSCTDKESSERLRDSLEDGDVDQNQRRVSRSRSHT